MAIINSREFTINVGKIADAEKWLSEEVGEKVMADKRVTDWLQNGMTNGDLISGAVDRFFTTIKDTRE